MKGVSDCVSILSLKKDGRPVESYERKKDLEEWQNELSKKEWFIKLQEEERKKRWVTIMRVIQNSRINYQK